ANLLYTWSLADTPPAPVTFSGATNGSNAASSIVAHFTQAGTYDFQVTVTDGQGGTPATDTLTVQVVATLTSITVTPASNTLENEATQQFAASALDQFGQPLANAPGIDW